MEPMREQQEDQREPVRTLKKMHRRVLGGLLEKAFTTPDAYPLTLKALTTACNQKSNRDPVVNYSEDDVLSAVEELQHLGLVAELHTDGGRAPRYRHLVRKRYPWSEPQLAIMTELWLRGRQQLGELRARASRMAPIESLEDLRRELQSLVTEGYVRCSGPLERRGAEVDHGFHVPGEKTSEWSATANEADDGRTPASVPTTLARQVVNPIPGGSTEVARVREACDALAARVEDLEARLSHLEQRLESLTG